MSYTYSKAELKDADFLSLVERSCFKHPWSDAVIKDALTEDSGYYYIIYEDGIPVGYAGFSKVLDEAHICNVAVLGDARGRGAGRALMNKLIEEAAKLEIEFMTLEVRESNETAINLYESLGFVCFGKRPHFYEDGEDALIYWLTIH